ncbi:hypothetical protein HZA57_08600, partial [Candidatus Poribacteria bacterium]|nr:hypothetical protein [Candidatus Poribacteria bacterium]
MSEQQPSAEMELARLRARLAELEAGEVRLRQTEAALRRQSQRTELVSSLLVMLNGCAN